jgi:hypothetical protein
MRCRTGIVSRLLFVLVSPASWSPGQLVAGGLVNFEVNLASKAFF